LLKINILEKGDIWLLAFENKVPFLKQLKKKKLFLEFGYSTFYKIDNVLLKCIKPQKFADYSRRFFASQAKREYIGTLKLHYLGICVPEVYGYSVNLNFFNGFESILFIEHLKDSITTMNFLQNEKSTSKRESILKLIAKDLSKMHFLGLHHKDTNLKNILIKDNNIYWIDNDIKVLPNFNNIKHVQISFKRIFNKNNMSEEEFLFLKKNYLRNFEKLLDKDFDGKKDIFFKMLRKVLL